MESIQKQEIQEEGLANPQGVIYHASEISKTDYSLMLKIGNTLNKGNMFLNLFSNGNNNTTTIRINNSRRYGVGVKLRGNFTYCR